MSEREADREAFETWAKSYDWRTQEPDLPIDRHDLAQTALDAWQAARASADARIEELEREFGEAHDDAVAAWSFIASIRFAIGDNGKRMQDELLEYCAELAAAVQPGMVVVPEEPTEAILNAMHERILILCKPEERSCTIVNDRELWRAMLDAAKEGK